MKDELVAQRGCARLTPPGVARHVAGRSSWFRSWGPSMGWKVHWRSGKPQPSSSPVAVWCGGLPPVPLQICTLHMPWCALNTCCLQDLYIQKIATRLQKIKDKVTAQQRGSQQQAAPAPQMPPAQAMPGGYPTATPPAAQPGQYRQQYQQQPQQQRHLSPSPLVLGPCDHGIPCSRHA